MKINLVTLVCVFFCIGCSLTPEYIRPTIELPPDWNASGMQDNVNNAEIWWETFNSQELNSLITKALEDNTDLLAGVQRIEQARSALKISGASLMPTASGSASAQKSRTNPGTGKSYTSTSLQTGIDVSYELDLFGANRADVMAARAGLDKTIYDQGALKLTLMGDVATTYFTLASLHERLTISDANLNIARELLRIIEARVQAGAESDLELAQQKGVVASNEALHANLIEQIENTQNALAALLGEPPGKIIIQRRELDGLTIPDIATGQPSKLVGRRPDLLAAEASLIAANANIGAARAAFFPSVSLGFGETLSLAGLGDPSTTIFSLASSISQPIFQGGRLEGGLEQATAQQQELVETYRGDVLRAFQEVEDAMSAVKSAQAQEIALRTVNEQAQYAYNLSKKRYDAGSIDYQTLLDTQNSRLSAEDNYAQARLDRLIADINLYRTLGGGWES